MNKFIEYLANRGKIEVALGTIIFLFVPSFLIMFIYFPDFFMDNDIIKISILNGAAVISIYMIQCSLYIITNLLFTRVGRSWDDILVTPILLSAINMQVLIFVGIIDRYSNIEMDIDLLFKYFIYLLVTSVIENLIMCIGYEIDAKRTGRTGAQVWLQECDEDEDYEEVKGDE